MTGRDALVGISPGNPLAPRQTQIIEMVSRGMTDKEVATALGIAVSTVKNTMVTIYEKLGAKNRAEAVYKWLSG